MKTLYNFYVGILLLLMYTSKLSKRFHRFYSLIKNKLVLRLVSTPGLAEAVLLPQPLKQLGVVGFITIPSSKIVL